MHDEFKRIEVKLRPELYEALNQECARLGIIRATLVKFLIREFVQDADNVVKRLIEKNIFRVNK